MIKIPIKYKTFDDEEVTEDLYFNLSKAELIELSVLDGGDFVDMLKKIVEDDDKEHIIKEFKNIIKLSYGQRSDDGKRFTKNEELSKEFLTTEAYSEFFMKLLTDEDFAAEFVNGIIPKDLMDEVAKIMTENSDDTKDNDNDKVDEDVSS